MRNSEHLSVASSEPQSIAEKEIHSCLASYFDKLLSNFPIEFEQARYPSIYLEMPETALRLAINISDGCVAISYGHRSLATVDSDAYLVFDSGNEAGWTLIEARYSPELRRAFYQSKRIAQDSQYFSFDEFAEYMLQRIQQEGWLEDARVPEPPQPQPGEPEWFYHSQEPSKDSHPVTW